MTRELDEALQSCLELIRGGEETIETAAARYPEFEDVLKPQLVTALWVASHRDALDPRPEFVSASRRRLIAKIRQESPVQRPLTWLERLQQAWTVQKVAPVAFVFILLLFLFVSGTIVTASKDALPGDDLYTVKRSLEEIALETTIDEATQAELNVRLTRQRLDEWMALVTEYRVNAAVSSASEIEAQISRTIESIESLASEDAVAAAILARELSDLLNEQQATLAFLRLRATSSSISPTVEKVIQVTQRGQEKAEETRTNTLALLNEPILDDTRMPPPTATRTPLPSPTPTRPRPTPTSPATEQVIAPEEPDPTATRTPIPSNTPTSPPPPTPTPVPTDTEKPPTDTPMPTDTPTPVPTDTNTPTDTPDTPTPTDTPDTPTPTDTPEPPTPVTPEPTPITPTAAPSPTQSADLSEGEPTPTSASSFSDPGNGSGSSTESGTPSSTPVP